MPSVRSFAKVQKQVKQKRGSKAGTGLHEQSRDSQRLRRAAARDDKVAKLSNARSKGKQPHLQRVAFFQDLAHTKGDVLSVDEALVAVNEYLSRNDGEIQSQKDQRRPGRPSSTREDLLTRQQKQEEQELDSGFWMPDLQDRDNLPKLFDWNGEWGALNPIRFCRLYRTGDVKPSKFPPTGLS